MTRRTSESWLIERVLAGDERAERALYEAHVERVYRLCFRIADGDADLAQEYTQDTFVRAFDRLARFRGESTLSTWLHAVALSVAVSGRRRIQRRRERESSAAWESAHAQSPQIVDAPLRQQLRRAIAKLPDPFRTVFILYDVEGYTHQEIGEILALPVGTSKARLSRARARLRAQLADVA
jgi:RNA polymerase sigma-70 factor, ECF subfamily